jgi:glycosyltransferase involved in cell wall biosynthesis
MNPGEGHDRHPRIALVLWNGDIGGAEIVTAKLAQRFRALGAAARIVFVARPEPLATRLATDGVPYVDLGFKRGRDVLRHPRHYAAGVGKAGPDGAILLQCGFMGAALRAGGYRGPIVAVEHGPVNERQGYSRLRRLFERLDRASGAWADSAEVAVSDYLLGQMRQQPHADQLVRIYNGVDPDDFATAHGDRQPDRELLVGFMGRLVKGKGVDHLVHALGQAGSRLRARLVIAGDGPDRPRLESLAQESGLDGRINYIGVVSDVPAFWRKCDIAVVPTAELDEGFSMVTLEAMSCGRPIIATRSGAIPELVIDGESGTLVPCGRAGPLADALIAYAGNPRLRGAHAAAAQARALERFDVRDTAQAYLDLFARLRRTSPEQKPSRTAPVRGSTQR